LISALEILRLRLRLSTETSGFKPLPGQDFGSRFLLQLCP